MSENTAILSSTYTTKYNGQQIKWFIGDWNSAKGAWEAWGSCNKRAYQLSAWYDGQTRILSDISVCNKPGDDYYHKETNILLTK